MRLARQKTQLEHLQTAFPYSGEVLWIGVRPARNVRMTALQEVHAEQGKGLDGDRYNSASGKRGVTLIQAEHLPVIASLLRRGPIEPEILRRNLVVSGISLSALIKRRFSIGDVILEGTSECDPCERMEAALGAGAFNAMRVHGGLCARIIQSGMIRLGDAVEFLENE